MKKPNHKLRLVLLYVFSFLVSILPLLVCLIVKWGDYTTTPGDTVKLCAGGIIVLIFVFLKVVGKLRMPRRIVLFGIVFILVYLLQSLLNDLLLLSGLALVGEFVDYIFFQRMIRLTKETIILEKSADVTSIKVEEVFKKYIGRI